MSHDAVIHLIDDDAAVRRAIAFLLTVSGFAVRTYESGDAFLAGAARAQPGCVVTDVRMPGIDGLTLQRRLGELGLAFPVVVLTGHADVALAVEAMKNGAVDFIEKPFEDRVLVAAVQAACKRHALSAQQTEEIAAIRMRIASLSIRERQVLDGLAAGQSNKLIADALKISPRTVEVHRAKVMIKMNSPSLPDLIRQVHQSGMAESKG